MEIDEDLLIEAVHDVHQARESADATTLTVALGPSADDGGFWDVTTVANNLAELESVGKLERTRPIPVALPQDDSGPQRRDDITEESTEAAADEEEGRPFFHRIGNRAVWLPLACVAALLIGFGAMTVGAQARRLAGGVGYQAGADDSGARSAAAVRRCPYRDGTTCLGAKPPRGRERASRPLRGVGAARLGSRSSAADRYHAPNLNPAGKAPPGQNR